MFLFAPIKKLFEKLVAEAGEEKAKQIVRELVADLNEAAQGVIDDPSKLKGVFEDISDDDALLVVGLLEDAVDVIEEAVQEGVNSIWAKVEDINPNDAATPAPDVDLDGDGE